MSEAHKALVLVSASGAVEAASRTHPGRDPDKQVNEDGCFQGDSPLGFVAIVCDGMGGHEGGRDASELAVRTVAEELRTALPTDSRRDCLRRAIELANERVYALGSKRPGARPGSTLVALVLHDEGIDLAHVGDSRIYRFHGAQVEALTRDHSAVQVLVDHGVLTQEQAKTHPEANKITRALGIASTVDVELSTGTIPYVPGDAFLLCSDGLSDLVDPPDLLEILTSGTPAQAAGRLIDLANARGGHDNITAVVLRCRVASKRTVAATLVEPPVDARALHPTEAMAPMAAAMGSAPAQTKTVADARANPTLLMGPVPISTAASSPPAAAPSTPSLDSAPGSLPLRAPATSTLSEAPRRWPLIVGVLLALLGLSAIAYLAQLEWSKRGHRALPPSDAVAPEGVRVIPAAPAPTAGSTETGSPAPSPVPSARPSSSAALAGTAATVDDPVPLPSLMPRRGEKERP